MTGQSNKDLWYVRKDGQVRGPLPARQITREILLSRIRANDDLSLDREHWRRLSALPQLVPEVMLRVDTEEGRQQLLLARLREDERQRDRRALGPTPADTSSRHGDRRTVGSFEAAVHLETGALSADAENKEGRNFLIPAALIMIAVIILVMYALL